MKRGGTPPCLRPTRQCNDHPALQLQCNWSALANSSVHYNEVAEHIEIQRAASTLQYNLQYRSTMKLQCPHCKTTSSAHIAIQWAVPTLQEQQCNTMQCAVQQYNKIAIPTLQNNEQRPHCNDHPEPCNWSVGKWQSRAVGSWGQESTALVIFAGLSFLGQYLLLLPCNY